MFQMRVDHVTNSNLKYLYVRGQLLLEIVGKRDFSISHVQSKFEHADYLTKSLRKESSRCNSNFVANMS